MEKTILHRTTVAVVGILVVFVVLFGVLRNTVICREAANNSPEAAQGAILFKNKGCAQCHAVDSAEIGMAPGLKGLFKMKSMAVIGKPPTEENVRDQITKPYKNMPSFAGRLNEKETDEIIAYLKTL